MPTPGVSLLDGNGNVITSTGGALSVILAGTGTQVAQATANVAVPSNAANVTVHTGPGRLFSVTVTAVGSVTGMTFTDGTGGTVIFALTAAQAAAIGTYVANVPFSTSLIVVGGATNASVTVAVGF